MAVSAQDKCDRQLDAENAVIGSILIDEQIVRDVLSAVDAMDFINPVNRQIYQTARALFRSGEPVDPITIRGKIGGQYSDYLRQLMEITPTSANWEAYAKIMHEQAALQRVRVVADKLAEAVTLEDCRPLCADLGQMLAAGRSVDAWGMKAMLDDFFRSQEPDQPAVEYIKTGISEIDQGTFIQLGDVLMIGGYPSDGKTALALMLAYHMAATHKVGFFSLETDKRKVRDRIVSHVAQIDFGDIKRREIDDGGWKVLAEKSKDFCRRDLTVLRASGMTATEIQAVSQAYGFQIILIDYVQLVVPETDRRAPRSEQMADVSRSLHTFAQKSGTMVIELAQLSRADKSGGWREPVMQDLKESGQFEQDADMILMLYRPNPKSEELDQDRNRILSVVKNKEGRRGRWPLYFDGERQTFSTLATDREDEGRKVMRAMMAAGKKARACNGQQAMKEFREITGTETADVPF